jgi:pimeloyl-ACP methyl ester carboxylesterase
MVAAMTTILLVHGAWHGPWCWDAFAARLRDAGHEVRAVALRDHPPSGPGRLRHRIRDYVEDLAAAVGPGPVFLVGHSMGGLVVQKYLERSPAAGAVLLAPVPKAGALGITLRFLARHPLVLAKVNLVRRLGPVVGTPALAREMLFTPDTPQSIVDSVVTRLQDESYRAYLDMIVSRPRPRRVTTPVLVLAGGRDGIFTVAEQRATARAYRTTAEIFDSMGHNLMVEPGWEHVADRVDSFFRGLVPLESPA